jgi:hypothetical protein
LGKKSGVTDIAARGAADMMPGTIRLPARLPARKRTGLSMMVGKIA